MFKNGIGAYATPIRVFHLCNFISNTTDTYSRKKLKEELFPSNDEERMFAQPVQLAVEIGLIEDDGSNLRASSLAKESKILTSMNNFRKYCNSIAFSNNDDLLYKVSSVMLKLYDSPDTVPFLRENFTIAPKFIEYISNHINMVNVPDNMRGWRFWASFLGLGLVHNDKGFSFLPNMYMNLLDSIENTKLADGIYTIADFIERLSPYISEALPDNPNDHHLCLGLSNGLRSLHDNGHITLSHELDAKDVWYLTEMPNHSIPSTITHIRVNRGTE